MVGLYEPPSGRAFFFEKYQNFFFRTCKLKTFVLPQIVSIKQASQRMGLPEYYIRRLCREVPGMAFQSGIKWYINLGKMADYFNGGTTTS